MIDPCFLSRRFGFLLVSNLFLFIRFFAILSSMFSSSSFLNYALFLSLKSTQAKDFFLLFLRSSTKLEKCCKSRIRFSLRLFWGICFDVFEVFINPLSTLVRFIPRWLSIRGNSIRVSSAYGKPHSGPFS